MMGAIVIYRLAAYGFPGSMADSMHNECPVAIFCGGNNLRLGRIAGVQAKALLAAHDTPLLWRLIDQLKAAGFTRIVAATTPRLERQIAGSVHDYVRTSSPAPHLEVVATAEQQRGLVFGLARLLEQWTAERCLICFGDIFFLGNPFPAFRPHVEAEHHRLGVAPVTFDEEWRLGGLVYGQGDSVLSIVERPTTRESRTPFRWSGTALFPRRQALEDLGLFTASSGDDPPPGDFFEFQRRRGRDLRFVTGPDFVNVNSPDQHLLASLYARIERDSTGEPLSGSLVEATRALRGDIARRAEPRTP